MIDITINGHQLTYEEALALRLAIVSFWRSLSSTQDQQSKEKIPTYESLLARLTHVQKYMQRESPVKKAAA